MSDDFLVPSALKPVWTPILSRWNRLSDVETDGRQKNWSSILTVTTAHEGLRFFYLTGWLRRFEELKPISDVCVCVWEKVHYAVFSTKYAKNTLDPLILSMESVLINK